VKKAVSIFWPSLALGAIGTALLFTIIDPVDLVFVGPLELPREAGYVIAFLFLWGFAAAAARLMRFLARRRTHAAR
jgi:hypothetical protein